MTYTDRFIIANIVFWPREAAGLIHDGRWPVLLLMIAITLGAAAFFAGLWHWAEK